MAKGSIKRQQEKANARKLVKLKYHLETMAAAYAKHCNILPDEVVLRTDTVVDELGRPAGLKYFFEHHGKRVNRQEAHPDVLYLFDLAYALVKANEAKDDAALKEGLVDMKIFMAKYDEELTKEQEAADAQSEK
jgi:acyl-CoA-binding protein